MCDKADKSDIADPQFSAAASVTLDGWVCEAQQFDAASWPGAAMRGR